MPFNCVFGRLACVFWYRSVPLNGVFWGSLMPFYCVFTICACALAPNVTKLEALNVAKRCIVGT